MLTCLSALLVWAAITAFGADDLTVLPPQIDGIAPSAMMEVWLKKLAFAALDRREAEFEKLKSPEELRAYQQRRRDFFLGQLGGFPERTPLNAEVVGGRSFADYRIERVIFESQPHFHVTATLYLPLTPGPHPAVLHPTGHSTNAKARDLYQQASIVMAKHGLAVLCYDPIGQGERHHFFKPDGKLLFGGTTQEHQLMGIGCALLGSSLARYMIWDGMRGIDYLQSRADIDPKRIGCTGISGGGTMTSYLMALDDRIVSAAPGCYLTGFRRLLETISPQDIEQNIPGQIAFGLDHGDYVLMRAPQPTLIMAATQDYFDIQGAWDLFRQAKRFYTRLGFAERVDLIEPDTQHGFPTEMRVGAARWMRRWLLDQNDAVTEPEFPVLKDEDLQCTPEGGVLRLPGERSLFELNVEWNSRLAEQRRRLWQNSDKAAALAEVRRLAGIRRAQDIPRLKVEKAGSLAREGYRIDKLILQNEPGLRLPVLDFVPAKAGGRPHLYLHGDGKHVDAGPGGPIEQLVRAGQRVLAVDLRGIGETERRDKRSAYASLAGPDWPDTTLAYLLGQSYVGMRAEDILACARFLAEGDAAVKNSVDLTAIGEAGVPALHAVALDPDLFASAKLIRSLVSWENVLHTPLSTNQFVNIVHGALRAYDLPDLVASLPKGKMRVIDPVGTDGKSVPRSKP